ATRIAIGRQSIRRDGAATIARSRREWRVTAPLFAAHAGVHERSTLVSTYRAARASAQHVTRCICTPADHEWRQRQGAMMPAVMPIVAVEPAPMWRPALQRA